MAGKDLELALRIKTDLKQGQADLEQLGNAVQDVGAKAAVTDKALTAVGETADEQAARIRAMVQASLQQQSVLDQVSHSTTQLTGAVHAGNAAWAESANAQTAAMNAYANAERATARKAAADASAAAAAQKAALAVEKEGQELQQLLGRIDPVIRKLDELDEMEQQLRRSRAAGQIDVDTFDTYNAKLQEQRVRLGGTNDAMRTSAITAGQYRQAMRQLPMQITDVTTSLASGMPIWLVAVQQGGQIKDSFGGIGNAARALVSTLTPLTVGIGAAVLVLGSLALAYQQGSQESVEFYKSIVLTGNAAGTSTDRLTAMAQAIDGISGTQRQASAALAEVTRTGKFAADQLQQVATTAVVMQNTLGRAVSETVAEFAKLADDPVRAAAELNREYNFLTAAVFEQISALREQGDEAAATQLAMDSFASAMQERSNEIANNLGILESAWKGIKAAASEAWDAMLDVGRADTLEEQLADLARTRTEGRYGPRGDRAFPSADPEREAALDLEENKLRLQIQQRDTEAAWQAEMAKLNSDSIEAQEALGKMREQSLTRVEQKERAIAEYRTNVEKIRAANPDSALISDDQVSKDLAAIEKRYEERVRKTRTRPVVDKELKAQEAYLAQLERQAATLGMTAAQVREYELAEKGLTGAMRARAEAALATVAAAERQREIDADNKQLNSLRADLLAAQGDQAGAAAIQIEQRYGEMIKRLQARGDEAGLDLINSLINVEQAQAQLDQLDESLERIFAEQSRRESSISTELQAGLISELGARQQILDLNQATADQVEQLLPLMRELAAVTGDPAAIERVKDLQARLGNLRVVANEFSNALKAGFETGIQTALRGLADGTMNLQEAALSLLTSISSAMADLAAQQLAQMATSSLAGMFGGGAGDDTGLTAGAAAVTGSALALSTAGGTLLTGAAAIQAAAASLAAASTTSAVSGAAGYTGAFGFAGGGHVRGPGTQTSDSIRVNLSDYEYVTRAAVVTQPGALDFLDDFNARGMAALADWQPRVNHSTGGLAGVPAPAMPAPTLGRGRMAEPAAAMSATLRNSQTFNLIDSPERIAEALQTRAGEEAFTVMLSRDPAKFRSLLQITG